MRQAGRYLPEYRETRKKAGSFLDLCYSPEYATEVTLQPIRRYGFDAAILFSDILVIPYALGQKLEFVKGEGPQLPALNSNDIALNYDSSKLEPIIQTVKNLRADLPPEKTVIGFAGAPWTVACYMISGSNFECEFRLIRPDGDIVWIQVRSAPRAAEGGVVVAVGAGLVWRVLFCPRSATRRCGLAAGLLDCLARRCAGVHGHCGGLCPCHALL